VSGFKFKIGTSSPPWLWKSGNPAGVAGFPSAVEKSPLDFSTQRTTWNGRCFLNLGGFAPASEWDEFSVSVGKSQEVNP